jgi:hypothetical protein
VSPCLPGDPIQYPHAIYVIWSYHSLLVSTDHCIGPLLSPVHLPRNPPDDDLVGGLNSLAPFLPQMKWVSLMNLVHQDNIPSPLLVTGRYPTTVATLSRRARDVVEDSFVRTSDMGLNHPSIISRLQDFGFRCRLTEARGSSHVHIHLFTTQFSVLMQCPL